MTVTNRIFATIIILFCLSSGIVSAQSLNKPKLDSLFDILAGKNKAMGSIALSKNGIVLYSRAIGYSVISEKEKKYASVQTKYRIGSISKMFTATMIFQLIEENKIRLTTTLDTYFPQLPNAREITISNLLNHRSGLHNFTNDSDYATWMTQPKTEDEMLAVISMKKTDFQPNEKASYSNANYVVLGYIIEKICKKPYNLVLDDRIISKIGLAHTYYGGKTNPGFDESFSYEFDTNWKQKTETDMSIPGGAGAIVSAPTDLIQFIEALFSFKLISKSSLLQMKTITDGYGMGMLRFPFNAKRAYGHTGGIDGFTSMLTYFPDDSLALAYCSNGQVYPMNDILIGVLSIYFNKPYSIPSFNIASMVLKTEDLDKYLGAYSSVLVPVKIKITKNNTMLIAQATGQQAFLLAPTEKDKFSFEQAGVQMEFNTDKNELILKQGGKDFLFTRDK